MENVVKITENEVEKEVKDAEFSMEEPTEFKTDFNEGELAEAEAEIMKGFKKLEYPKLGTVYVRFPTLREDSEISEFYSSVYFRLLKETTLPTMKQLLTVLEEKGLWTEEDDKKIESIQTLFTNRTVSVEEIKLKKHKTKEDEINLKSLMKERSKYYNEFIAKLIEKNTLLDNCIEKKAEQEVTFFKIAKCVYKEDNTLKWNSLNEVLDCSSEMEFDKLIVDCVNFWRGISLPLSDF